MIFESFEGLKKGEEAGRKKKFYVVRRIPGVKRIWSMTRYDSDE
jgi:hypothetical protein